MTDFRALCADLYGIFEKYDDESNLAGIYWDMEKECNDILDRARAALAQPEPEGPSIEGVEELCEEHCFNVEGYESIECLQGLINEAIARWGNPAPLADTHYEWELEDAEGEWQAGGSSNSQTDVEREGMRYLQTYAQNGPHKLIIRQHTTQTINEIVHLETQDEPYVKDHIPFA